MKALLIDDHPLILAALQTVIKGLGDEFEVSGVATARAAREVLAADSDFELVLLDLHLGDADGFELLAELRAAYPALPVVVVSASDRSADVIRAIDLGAMGYVPKRSSADTLHEALRTVLSGGIYIPAMAVTSEAPQQTFNVGTRSRDAGAPTGVAPSFSGAFPGATSAHGLKLTPRQGEVLGLLLQGQSNKLIARSMNLSVETVKDHVAAVLRALNVSSRTQAVLAVSRMSSTGPLSAWRESRLR